MNRVWVTGASGQLGRCLQALKKEDPSFCFTTREQLDLRDEAMVAQFVEHNRIQTVINCAAYTAVDAAESHPHAAYELNRDVVADLGRICKPFSVRLIHLSTDYVFDGQAYRPYPTTAACGPINVYGRSKWEGEEALRALALPNSLILRTSWLYSVYGNNFVKTMLRLGQLQEEVQVVADQVGRPTCAEDLARFIVTQLLDFESSQTETYHYANAGLCSWYDLAVHIMQNSKSACRVAPIPASAYATPAARPYYSVLDTERTQKDFKVRLPYWNSSLTRCITQLQATG